MFHSPNDLSPATKLGMFGCFDQRAKRVIFFASCEARLNRAEAIQPEHLLAGLTREDPLLFSTLTLRHAELANDVRYKLLGRPKAKPLAEKENEPMTPQRLLEFVKELGDYKLPLSTLSQNIARFANRERERFGHDGVTTQLLLRSLLICGDGRSKWSRLNLLRRPTACELLATYGVTASAVETKFREDASGSTPS